MSRSLHLVAFVLLLGAMACGSDDSSVNGPAPVEETGLPAPTTPAQLMANLDTAISTLDVDEYAALLHEDFSFWFSPDDIDASGVVSWSRANELAAITNLFSGETGIRSDGVGNTEVIPGVTRIEILYFQQEDWTSEFDDGAEFASADTRGRFQCNFTVRYTEADRITSGDGVAVLYLIGVPVEVDGEMQTQYQIAAWKDLGNQLRKISGSSDSTNWGRLKLLFRGD